jgi:pimeloyl-ACP methyl ester carboxylesterase
MDGLGIERALLVGNSSGGTLALDLALDHPERVAALVLVAPWVYVQRPTFPRWVTELPQMERLSLFLARLLGGRGGLLGLSYADASRITPERRELARLHMGVQHWDLAWGALLNRSLADPVTVAPRLPEVDVPVLLVTGDRDRLVPPEDTRRVAELVPGADLQVLPGCGHVPHEECPDAFGRLVDAWLAARPWEGI